MFSRATAIASRLISTASTRAVGKLSAQAIAMQPLPVPMSSTDSGSRPASARPSHGSKLAAISSAIGSGDSISDDLGTEAGVSDLYESAEGVNVLLDGPAFGEAVNAAVAAIDGPSILLDGEAFDAAVGDAVAAAESPSALLDGEAFDAAVGDAVASFDSRTALVDGAAFDAAVAEAVALVAK